MNIDELIADCRLLEADHEPDGWPAIQMKAVTALCDEIERLRHQPAAWRDLKLGEKIIPGDRFCNRMHEWVTVTPEHVVYITAVSPGSYPMQRKIGGGDG